MRAAVIKENEEIALERIDKENTILLLCSTNMLYAEFKKKKGY